MLEQVLKGGPFEGLLRAKPAKPGTLYGVPSGGSAQISMVTGLVLIALWFVVTEMGWVKPLFLPSPMAVWDKFILASTEGVANSTLAEHTFASLSRVLGAFVLATVTAIPVGILMGTSRVARGLFDPIIEFYRPLPPLAYLPLVIIWLGIGEFSKVFLIFLAIFAPPGPSRERSFPRMHRRRRLSSDRGHCGSGRSGLNAVIERRIETRNQCRQVRDRVDDVMRPGGDEPGHRRLP